MFSKRTLNVFAYKKCNYNGDVLARTDLRGVAMEYTLKHARVSNLNEDAARGQKWYHSVFGKKEGERRSNNAFDKAADFFADFPAADSD